LEEATVIKLEQTSEKELALTKAEALVPRKGVE